MAKSNGFKLQPVLDYKEHVEDGFRVALAEAERMLRREEERLSVLQEQHSESMQQLSDRHRSERLDVLKISRHLLYIQVLEERIKSQKEKVHLLQAEVDRQRDQLIEAAKEKKQLEKLKETNDAQIRSELRLAENRTNDEISMIQFNHRARRTPQAGEV